MRRLRSSLLPVVVLSLALFICGCGKATPTGYWEGKGKSSEIKLKDNYRQLTRSADYEFWFVLDEQGNATGEIDLTYDAVLKVENLPSFSAAGVSLKPDVGGKITDLNPKRHFPLVGYYDGKKLALEIGQPEPARPKLEFTIRADPGVSAGLAGGHVSVGEGTVGGGPVQVIKVPMMPFSPFAGGAVVEKRPGGPYAASYEENAEKYSISWSARQMGGEQRKVQITPEMQQALDDLRRQSGH